MAKDTNDKKSEPKTWFERLGQSFSSDPKNKSELMTILKEAESRALIDQDELEMIEGAINVSTKKARDIMIPKAQIRFIRQGQTLQEFLPIMINAHHSRFPVLAKDSEEVIGILHAKDILKYNLTDEPFVLDSNVLHETVIVPESKRLDNLLREFQNSHNHMAIVIDEYGNISGAITIEDILEEIVGEIEDEFDRATTDFIQPIKDNAFLVKAITPVEVFNAFFNSTFIDDKVDTMGGIIIKHLGYLPQENEQLIIAKLEITIKSTTERMINDFTVKNYDNETN